MADIEKTPPAPLGGLTEGEREALEYVEASNRAYPTSHLATICAALRRLTAPRAEGVDAETARMLVELVEGRGCLRWASNSGVRLKDTPEWVAFYNATKAALTAAAPKVGAPLPTLEKASKEIAEASALALRRMEVEDVLNEVLSEHDDRLSADAFDDIVDRLSLAQPAKETP